MNCAKPLKYVNQDPLSNVRICPIPRYFRDIVIRPWAGGVWYYLGTENILICLRAQLRPWGLDESD